MEIKRKCSYINMRLDGAPRSYLWLHLPLRCSFMYPVDALCCSYCRCCCYLFKNDETKWTETAICKHHSNESACKCDGLSWCCLKVSQKGEARCFVFKLRKRRGDLLERKKRKSRLIRNVWKIFSKTADCGNIFHKFYIPLHSAIANALA